jgi:hypothetical protein
VIKPKWLRLAEARAFALEVAEIAEAERDVIIVREADIQDQLSDVFSSKEYKAAAIKLINEDSVIRLMKEDSGS